MATPQRRNDPCACGSGLRFKECHGRLGDANTAAVALEALAARALQHHQQGNLELAHREYREILALSPGDALATHYLGMIAWQKGDLAEGERLMRESLAAKASVPDFHNNLGLLLRDTGRFEEALACYERALAVDPDWYQAFNNRGLALEDLRRLREAEVAYREALARAPHFAAAQQNLARLLLLDARFEEGWERYRWRLLAQGESISLPDANAKPLPADLRGRNFELLGEQGIGDVLFFLRFAPELTRRGAVLGFRGDARLTPLLAPTGLFGLGFGEGAAPLAGAQRIHVGDLPWFTSAHHHGALPPPLALAPDPAVLQAMQARLAALGPAPVIALTWRAGVAPTGPSSVQLKEIPIDALGLALRGHRATWISVQRHPREGELEQLSAAIGAPVHDFSASNEDLAQALALLDCVDDYTGPSNANTHLRASLGRSQHVLVVDPPEWRWLSQGDVSPWFPAMPLYRPDEDTSWGRSLDRLARTLGGRA